MRRHASESEFGHRTETTPKAELEERARRTSRVIETEPSEDVESELGPARRRAQDELGDVERDVESAREARDESGRSRKDSDVERSS